MADQNLHERMPDISDLNKKARSGEITVDTFFDEIERRGITGLRQAHCAAQAFGIGLREAKLVFIERQPGGIHAWEEQFREIDYDATPEDLS